MGWEGALLWSAAAELSSTARLRQVLGIVILGASDGWRSLNIRDGDGEEGTRVSIAPILAKTPKGCNALVGFACRASASTFGRRAQQAAEHSRQACHALPEADVLIPLHLCALLHIADTPSCHANWCNFSE